MNTQARDERATRAGELFEDLPRPSLAQVEQAQTQAAGKRRQGAPRLLEPNRTQIELRASDLESLLPEDHRARLVWGYVERQDLSALFDAIKARGATPGRRAIDPRILFALWLYAVLDGVGSGREVARLCREHDAYRWICGGVSVNYHALNDFRSGAGNDEVMDEVLSDNVAALAAVGAITLERVAQDGMRVRAHAGAASFRRQARLEEHQAEARELVQALKTQAQADPGQASRRAQAARLRAAQEREQRIAERRWRDCPKMAAAKRRNGDKPEDARASTTDADAQQYEDGRRGLPPGLQRAVRHRLRQPGDRRRGRGHRGQRHGAARTHGRAGRAAAWAQPRQQWLVDGGFPAHEQIDAVADKTEVYAPVPEPRAKKDEQGNEVEQDQ